DPRVVPIRRFRAAIPTKRHDAGYAGYAGCPGAESDADADEPVVRAVDRAHLHGLAGVRGVDHLVAAEVDADVAAAVEDHQVARQGRPGRDPRHGALRRRRVRERDADVGVDELGEAGAVEARRVGAAVAVR